MIKWVAGLVIVMTSVLVPNQAFALISGGEGNEPLTNRGWPKGAEAIFNHTGRVAWWEGPPFGGGQWHAEGRGDVKVLNDILADFAKLDVKSKRIVVHDGTGHSFWLAPNREPEKLEAAKIDWMFMVWQPENWTGLRKFPADLNPTELQDDTPPSQVDVFTANIRWSDVIVPETIEVIDRRLESHGFSKADGVVLEGHVTDLATKQPIAATIQLQRIEPQKGGYLYPVVSEVKADAQGHWVLKNVPAGWYRVVVDSEGFAPRVAGHHLFDEQPQWNSDKTALTRPATVSGRIKDAAGQPLADVEVTFHDVQPESGGRYESPREYRVKTNAEGRFTADRLPAGKATVRLRKPGYCRPGLGMPVTTPKSELELQMIKSSNVRVTVDFTNKKRPEDYLVNIEPEGGNAVGTYGGSGNINAQNEITFKEVPPGIYVINGRPNRSTGNQSTESSTIELKGGESVEVTLKAK